MLNWLLRVFVGELLILTARPTPFVARRTISYTPIRRAQETEEKPEEPPKEQRRSALSSIRDFFLGGSKPTKKPQLAKPAPVQREGTLSSDSIFADETTTTPATAQERRPDAQAEEVEPLEQRVRDRMAPIIDPRPEARKRWERKMIVRAVRKRGRLTKREMVMATEREALVKSHWFKTSVKKLVPLARQIAGKNIDDAILQMQFSKKKAAKDVLEHLKHAKNVAIVKYGMGLGHVQRDPSEPLPKPQTVILKNGEKRVIREPTAIYIAQAWVNRGPYDYDYDHRAMGRINVLRPPHTGLSVLLKEERTLIREWQEREAKALRQRKQQLWTQLPDRKIYGQNQYYSW